MKILAVLALAVLGSASVALARPESLSSLGGTSIARPAAPILLADDHHHDEHHDSHHHDTRGGWGPRPGWHSTWRYPKTYHPHWWAPTITFPGFVWLNVNPGVWQCTAFNQYDQYLAPYSYVASSQSQAAYGALYDCGGRNYQATGCYIPQGYCQVR